MDERLQRIKEIHNETYNKLMDQLARNGELAHRNFELKKRIADLEADNEKLKTKVIRQHELIRRLMQSDRC